MALHAFKKSRVGYAAPPSPAARSLLPSFPDLLQGTGGQRHMDRIRNLSRTQPAHTGDLEPQRRGNFSDARDVLGRSLLDDSDDDIHGVQQEDDSDVLAAPLDDSSSEESMYEQEDDLSTPMTSTPSGDWTLPHYHGGCVYEEDVPSLNIQKKLFLVCRDDFSTDDEDDDVLEEDSLQEDLFSWATEKQIKEEEDVVEFPVPPVLKDLLCSESLDLEEDGEVAASPDVFIPPPPKTPDNAVDAEVATICAHLTDRPDHAHLQQTPDSGRTEPLPTIDSPTPLGSSSHPGGASVPECPTSSTEAATAAPTHPSCDSTTPGGSTTPSIPSTSVFRRQRAPNRILPRLTPFQQSLMEMAFRQNIYVGHRRHHAMARGLDLSADVIKEYFVRWRRSGFRKLRRNGMSDYVTKIRSFNRSTLPFYQGRYPAPSTSTSEAFSFQPVQPQAVYHVHQAPQAPQAQLAALPGAVHHVQLHHIQEAHRVHQVSMSEPQLSQELRDQVQAVAIQCLASQPPQVPEMASSSSGHCSGHCMDVHHTPAGRHQLAPYRFNGPWVYRPNNTQ